LFLLELFASLFEIGLEVTNFTLDFLANTRFLLEGSLGLFEGLGERLLGFGEQVEL
jgi:hypothetical protein